MLYGNCGYMEILRGGTPAGARQMKKVRADKKGGR